MQLHGTPVATCDATAPKAGLLRDETRGGSYLLANNVAQLQDQTHAWLRADRGVERTKDPASRQSE
jgi:hypothetical protein